MARAAHGFTLIELVVAMAILLVVMIGVMSSVAFAYTSSNDTEMRNTAKNIATYTLEYLRARTVTTTDSTHPGSGLAGVLGISSSSTGTYGWYAAGTNSYGAFPSMVDVGNLPLQSNGKPCNYAAQSPTNLWTVGMVDNGSWSNTGSGGGIGAGGAVIRFASKHAALPTETYGTSSTTRLAWTTTLQGYVSVMDATPASAQNPANEDKNLARMVSSSTTNMYRTLLTGAWTGLIVRYPGVYLTATSITSFTPGSTYLAKVYTTDPERVKMTAPNPGYNPYYIYANKAATQDYRGFRVLTQVVARSAAAADPTTGFRHVQYYDVTVTVLWMNGTREGSYDLASQIVAY